MDNTTTEEPLTEAELEAAVMALTFLNEHLQLPLSLLAELNEQLGLPRSPWAHRDFANRKYRRENSKSWKGGRYINDRGYVLRVLDYDHPMISMSRRYANGSGRPVLGGCPVARRT